MRPSLLVPGLLALLLLGCDGGSIDASELRRELTTTWEQLREMAPEEGQALREGLEQHLERLRARIEAAREELAKNDELRRALEDTQHEVVRLLDQARRVGRPAFDRAVEESRATWDASRDELIRAGQEAEAALDELLGNPR